MKCIYKMITMACMLLNVGLYPLGYAYVTNSISNDISVVDLTAGETIDTIDLGFEPGGIAITPDKTKVYVANYNSQAGTTVTSIDVLTNTPDSTLITVGSGPLGIAMGETLFGLRAYVANQASKNVTPIVVDTDAALSNITLPGVPQAVVVSPDGTTAYVGSSVDLTADNFIYPIDLTQNPAVLQTGIGIPVPFDPFSMAITPDGNTLVAIDLAGATIVVVTDLTTTTPVVTPLTGPALYTYVTVYSDTKALVSGVDGSITPVILGTTPSLETAIPISGAGILFGLTLTEDGTEGYVADYSNNALIPLTITSTSITAGTAIPVGTAPRYITLFGSGSSNSSIATLSKNIFLNRTDLIVTLASNPFSLTGNVVYQLYNNDVLVAATRMNNPLLFEVRVPLSLPLNLRATATANGEIAEVAITV